MGVANATPLPHFTFDCTAEKKFCSLCYCYCCDVPFSECLSPDRHSLIKSAKDVNAKRERETRRRFRNECGCPSCLRLSSWNGGEFKLELRSWRERAHAMDVLDWKRASYRIENGVTLVLS